MIGRGASTPSSGTNFFWKRVTRVPRAGLEIDHEQPAGAKKNPPAAQRLVVQDPHAPKPAAADVVLANILSMPLKLLAPVLISLLAPGGKLVLSGILQRQADEVAQAYRPALALEIYGEREGWVCLAGSAAQPHS
jgi:ribosomal protein L11 methyltransferase